MNIPSYPAFDGSQPCAQTDPEAWFPEPSTQHDRMRKLALQLCEACPFLRECGDWALAVHVEGVWAGQTESWRREQRKHLGIVAVSLVPELPRETQQSRIFGYAEAGLTHAEIADELGIRVESVSQALRRQNAKKAA